MLYGNYCYIIIKNFPQKFSPCAKLDIDEALFKWFRVMRNENIPLSGPIFKSQAEKFARQLGVPAEMKYIRDIYNFWSQKYILASFKYMSSIFQIYVRYILANIYIYNK